MATARQSSPSTPLRVKAGTRGGGRTHNLRLRRPTLYPIELLAHTDSILGQSAPAGNQFSSAKKRGTAQGRPGHKGSCERSYSVFFLLFFCSLPEPFLPPRGPNSWYFLYCSSVRISFIFLFWSSMRDRIFSRRCC